MNYTVESLQRLHQKSTAGFKSTKKFLAKLSKLNPRKLDTIVHQHHAEEFLKINCLDCANCCKTLSPAIFDNDIRRMSKSLKLTPSVFTLQYLVPDTDGSYILKNIPCIFLDSDNFCKIYNDRPKACREYPHTDRKRVVRILNLTAQNSKVCPAVFNIINKLKKDV